MSGIRTGNFFVSSELDLRTLQLPYDQYVQMRRKSILFALSWLEENVLNRNDTGHHLRERIQNGVRFDDDTNRYLMNSCFHWLKMTKQLNYNRDRSRSLSAVEVQPLWSNSPTPRPSGPSHPRTVHQYSQVDHSRRKSNIVQKPTMATERSSSWGSTNEKRSNCCISSAIPNGYYQSSNSPYFNSHTSLTVSQRNVNLSGCVSSKHKQHGGSKLSEKLLNSDRQRNTCKYEKKRRSGFQLSIPPVRPKHIPNNGVYRCSPHETISYFVRDASSGCRLPQDANIFQMFNNH